MRSFVLDAAARVLRLAGYRVLPPPPLPEIGSIWTPTRGMGVARRVVDASDAGVWVRRSAATNGASRGALN